MLEWTTCGPDERFGMVVHHDDAEREFACGRKSHVGMLEKALWEAPSRGLGGVSPKDDRKAIDPSPSR